MLFAIAVAAAAFAPQPYAHATAHIASSRNAPPQCFDDERVDTLVMYTDAGVLLGYGIIQALFDTIMMPLAKSPTGLFVPVAQAPLQGVVVAMLWVGVTLAIGGYRPSCTRTLPSKDAIVPLLSACTRPFSRCACHLMAFPGFRFCCGRCARRRSPAESVSRYEVLVVARPTLSSSRCTRRSASSLRDCDPFSHKFCQPLTHRRS